MQFSKIITSLCFLFFLAVPSLTFTAEAQVANVFDIDGNGETEPLSDGLLTLRYQFGFRGDSLISQAIGAGATRTTASQIETYLNAHSTELDIDGNGKIEPLSDGLLLLRYLFGFRGDSLINQAVAADATRKSAGEIETYISGVIAPATMMLLLDDLQHGLEPWITDGTKEGTRFVVDSITRFNPSFPRDFLEINGTVYFTADDTIHGRELWKTDGSETGTELVKDINPNSADSNPTDLIHFNGYLYFRAASKNEFGSKPGLWKSDGTKEGTILVKADINPYDLTTIGEELFFVATDENYGTELWKSDGTNEGTVLVKDINLGTEGSSLNNLTDFNGSLFFTLAIGNYYNQQLWKSDGTEAGTVPVGGLPDNTYNYLSYLTVADDYLFFKYQGDLWKTDGTDEGTGIVKNTNTIGSWLAELTYVNGLLYFNLSTDAGEELWKSDGTNEGTVMVKDIRIPFGSNPRNLIGINETLFFTAVDGDENDYERNLWKSDGTEEGTVLVKNINLSYQKLVNLNGILYFSATNNVDGYALWKSDGTEIGTEIVKDIYEGFENDESSLSELANVNGILYFSGSSSLISNELWKSDGTKNGTQMVKNINMTTMGIYYGQNDVNKSLETLTIGTDHFFISNGSYFDRDIDKWVYGSTLWKTNYEGTTLIKSSTSIGTLTSLNGMIFFLAYDGPIVEMGFNVPDLWRSDGTQVGTVKFREKIVGLESMFNSFYFLQCTNLEMGECEYWKSDGSEEGTIVDTVFRDTNYFYTQGVTIYDTYYFLKNEGSELWKSDGTTTGTIKIKSYVDHYIGHMTNVSGMLYFIKDDDELWKSDGTEAGTILVKDIRSEENARSGVSELTNVNGVLFFRADDGVNGAELWKSDGTLEGTVVVKDIRAGVNGAYPQQFTNFNNILFFVVYSETGYELWKSDGNEVGTEKVKDIISNLNDPRIVMYGVLNGRLIFTSIDDQESDENKPSKLWISDGTEFGTQVILDFGAGPEN